MESLQIRIQSLDFIVRESMFPRNKGFEEEHYCLHVSAGAKCGKVCVEACDFSHVFSVTWIPKLMNLFTSAFPQRLSCSLAVIFFFLLPWQTCMGKDVTLHVSASNPAMLLYQKFGFKTEEYILDFYDKYYPLDSKECKHAFFLRLRRWSVRAVGGSVKSPACWVRYYRGFRQRMMAVTWELEHVCLFR